MKRKLYPADQIQTYLVIDVIVIVYLFFHVLTVKNPPFGLIGSFFLLGLFLCFFYISLWYKDWRLLVSALLGCGVLAVFAMLYNEWLFWYSFIFADLLGRARMKTHIAAGILGFGVLYVVTRTYVEGEPFSFLTTVHLPILIILLLIPIVVHIIEKTRILKRNLATANKKIEKYIQEEERQRIARDLHDTLGQTLTMVKLKSELSIRLIDNNPEQAKTEMNEVMCTSRLALKQVRGLVTSMKFISLNQEIEDAGKLLHSSGIQLDVIRHPFQPNLSQMTETMLALSIREIITNVIKHSMAKNCIISNECTDKLYILHIEDDGVGFKNKEMEGNGLISIQERIRLLNGHVNITDSSRAGVLITVSVPIIKQERVY